MTFFPTAALALCAVLFLAAPAYADDYQESSKLFKQGSYVQALDKVNAHLGASPKDAKGRFLKGLILAEQKKSDEAIKIFSALTEDYPDLPEPYNNLAVLYAAQGQYEKARGALETAIRTNSSYATAHENLGDIYAKLASQAYDKALQLDRSNTTAQVKLALVKDLFSSKGIRPAGVTQAEPPKAEPPKPELAKSETPSEAVKPAAKPAETAGKATDGSEEVLQTVRAWAKAWSDKDASAYLAFYANEFEAPGESRSVWEKTRKERIAKPKQIQVAVLSPTVRFSDANHASVSFKQSYRSDSLKTLTNKTLTLVKTDGKWLIQQERVGK